MLPRAHRLTSSRDFRAVARRGARAGGAAVVVSVLLDPDLQTARGTPAGGAHAASDSRWRCGLIVSKAVGNAVVRHRTARRLRHIMLELLGEEPALLPPDRQADLVLRALPGVVETEHDELRHEVRTGVRRAARKAERQMAERRAGRGQG